MDLAAYSYVYLYMTTRNPLKTAGSHFFGVFTRCSSVFTRIAFHTFTQMSRLRTCNMSSDLRSAWRYAADSRFRAFTRRKYPGRVLNIQIVPLWPPFFFFFLRICSAVFGLVKHCHVNVRLIRKISLPFSPLALSRKQGLSRYLVISQVLSVCAKQCMRLCNLFT